MSTHWTQDLKQLIWGRLLESAEAESILFRALLCDLRPRFIPKGRIGRGYRAIARNGRVLLTSRLPLEALVGREAVIRLQPWRKIILPGEKPQVYGILLSVRCIDPGPSRLDRAIKDETFQTRLSDDSQAPADMALDVGGGMTLLFVIQSNHVHVSRPANDNMEV